jgi:hypothetical protein
VTKKAIAAHVKAELIEAVNELDQEVLQALYRVQMRARPASFRSIGEMLESALRASLKRKGEAFR